MTKEKFQSLIINERINDTLLIQYREQVLSPFLWITQADELIEASKKIEPNIKKYWKYWDSVVNHSDFKQGEYSLPPDHQPKRPLQSVYFMLMAYAVENYFKAMMILENLATFKKDISENRKLPSALQSHNLLLLAKKAHFDLSYIETSLLIRLSRNAVWQGRYPVPTKPNELNSIEKISDKTYFTAFLSSGDMSNLNMLIRRIKSILPKNISTEENSPQN